MLTEDQRKELANELNIRIPDLTCPMCKSKNFILADGYFNNTIQDNFQGLSIGGPSIPTIPIVCGQCGFVSQHALGVLGKLPKDQTNEQNEPK